MVAASDIAHNLLIHVGFTSPEKGMNVGAIRVR
jgi:hypothetical protein